MDDEEPLEAVGPPESEPELEFVINKTQAFNKSYDIIDISQKKLNTIPKSINFSSYKEFEAAALAWRESVLSDIPGNMILPEPITSYYSKISPGVPDTHFRASKFNPKISPLTNKNICELENTIIDDDIIDLNKNFEYPAYHKSYYKYENQIQLNPWNEKMVPKEPDPNLFDTYEEYFAALKKWTDYGMTHDPPISPTKLPVKKTPRLTEIISTDQFDESTSPKIQYSSNDEIFRKYMRSPPLYKKIPLSYYHEIYRTAFNVYSHKREREHWMVAIKKQYILEKSNQLEELVSLLETNYSIVDEIINTGPCTPIIKPSPMSFMEGGVLEISKKTFQTSTDYFKKMLFKEVSLKTSRVILERNLGLFRKSDFPLIIHFADKCCSLSLAKRVMALIEILLSSDSRQDYFDILFFNPELLRKLCFFIGRFGFSNTPPICYQMPLTADVSYASAYESLVMSGLLFSLQDFFDSPNPIISHIIVRQFHAAAVQLQEARKAIIEDFNRDPERQIFSSRVILLALSMRYRPFHIAIFSPSPINTFHELLAASEHVPGTDAIVQRLIIAFETNGAANALLGDLIQFDIGRVSKKWEVLVPFASRMLDLIAHSDHPVITSTQIMAQSRSFRSKIDKNCYRLIKDIAEIFIHRRVFLYYPDDEYTTDRIFLCTTISQIILASENDRLGELFDALATLIFPAQWHFPAQFWMVFAAGLWKDDPPCHSFWVFFRELVQQGLISILPDYFCDQLTMIFKPGSFEYCMEILQFLSDVINCPDFLILERWFCTNDQVLRHSFRRIYTTVTFHRGCMQAVELYKRIVANSSEWENRKTGKMFYQIIKSEKINHMYL